MNILVNVLIDKGGAVIATERDIQTLRDECYDYAHEAAASMNIYTSHALDNLGRFSEHEPDAEHVRECMDPTELGNWRATMVMAATLATVGYLESQAEADLTLIEKAIQEAMLRGFEARKAYQSCACGWAAHETEDEWQHGCLFTWRGLDGGADAFMLRLSLSESAEAWIDLAWAD